MNVVLFDIDHTLMASPTGANHEASEKMFRQVFGLDAGEDQVEKVGKTEWGVIEEVLSKIHAVWIDDSHQVPEHAYKLWADALEEAITGRDSILMPGMWELVSHLAEIPEIKLGLLTGNSIWRSEVKLKSVGLDEFFKDRHGQLIGSFGHESRTRSGLLSRALDRLVYDHDCLTIIDDSLIGAKMLSAEEVHSLFVATGQATVDELKQYQDRVFPDLDEGRWQEAMQYIMECTFAPS